MEKHRLGLVDGMSSLSQRWRAREVRTVFASAALASVASLACGRADVPVERSRTELIAATTTNSSNFNGTAIPADRTIWLTSVMKVTGVGTAPVHLYLRDSKVTFLANGVSQTIVVPGADVTVDPAASLATTLYDSGAGIWRTTLPKTFSGNGFLTAVAFPVTADLPGGIDPVTWSGRFSSNVPGISINWQWGAAVYTELATDYNILQVKPVDDTQKSDYKNSDKAGTPEAFKVYVVGGARGGGGSNWTGGLSGTVAVSMAVQCADVVCVPSDQCHEVGVCDPSTGTCPNPAKPDGAECDDGKRCTQHDSCQGGTCVGADPVVCAASDQCHDQGICDDSTGVCSNPATGDGKFCDDGNLCTQLDVCETGACSGQSPVVCVALDQCHEAGECQPATGICTDPAKVDGSACSDGDLCTLTDTCQTGTCLGDNPVDCVASDQCHAAGSCDPASGACSDPVAPDGTRCNDGNGCTQNDFCALGACVGNNPVVCAPDPTCETQGVCMPANGECSAPSRCHVCGNGTVEYSEECDDGNTLSGDGCTTSCKTEYCGDGIVSRTVRALRFRWLARSCDQSPIADIAFFFNDAEVARVPLADTCGCQPELETVTVTDPALLALGSNGGNKLRVQTVGDLAWVAAQLDTPAGTIETMLWGTGGWNGPANLCDASQMGVDHEVTTNLEGGEECDDGNSVDDDVCSNTCRWEKCHGVVCQATDQCHDAGTCDRMTGACTNPAKIDGIACNDGNACTQEDRCQGGLCVGASPIVCGASDQCHGAGTCEPATGICTTSSLPDGTACDDGDRCTTADTCLAGACSAGAPVVCSAADQCHAAGICDSATGSCTNPPAPDGLPCVDGNACTQTDTCQAGACVGSSPVVCPASDQCHAAGTCDPASGACNAPAKPDGTPCSDGNACTQSDSCQAGACIGSNPKVCTASDQCHNPGTCDPASGACTNPIKTNGTACNDGSGCTLVDKCTNGACVGASPVVCPAPDQCHAAGTCVPSTGGCRYAAKTDGTTCNDGDRCTQVDTCVAGSCKGQNPVACGSGNQCQEPGQCDPVSGACLFPGKADGVACDDANAGTRGDRCLAGVCVGNEPLPRPVVTSVADSLGFIYQGPNASQIGVAANTIQAPRAAGLRGHVLSRDGSPLMGVTITVADHTEYGLTLSRSDGGYDLVVNGGLTLTVVLSKAGYLPAERPVAVSWQGFSEVDDVVLVPVDAQVTTVDLTQPSQQVAVGSVSTDGDGVRQAVLVVPAGTQAVMDLPNGTTVGMDTLNIRITEVTQGERGLAAMPAPLPGNTQYTYAVDYSTDEGLAANAKAIRFSNPIYHYSENFLGFPVGMGVPAGYYDRKSHAWLPMRNGAVVRVLSVTSGVAELDVNGSGAPAPADWKAAMGITDAELAFVGGRYQPGQTLWRVPVPHFTFMDYNYTGGPPAGASAPQCSIGGNPTTSPPTKLCGSIIEAQHQIVGERVPITGTPFSLNYRSNRVEGFKAAYQLNLRLSGPSVPESLLSIKMKASVAGRGYEATLPPLANSALPLSWDGRDGAGRLVNGQQLASVSVSYEYPLVYYAPSDALYHAAIDFGKLGTNLTTTGVAGRGTFISTKDMMQVVGTQLASAAKLGGWTLDVNHAYDLQRTLWRGDGDREAAELTAGAQMVSSLPRVIETYRIAPAADGSIYIAGGYYGGTPTPPDLPSHTLRKFDPRTKTYADIFTLAKVPSVENGYGGWSVRRITSLATGPDDTIYISADGGSDRYIDHISPAGNFIESWKVVDSSSPGVVGSLVVAKDGSVYFATVRSDRCLRLMHVTKDGQRSQVAGGDCSIQVPGGDGGPAINATFQKVTVTNTVLGPQLYGIDLALGPDGAIYISNSSECRVRRIGLDGIINTVAGSTCPTPGQHTGDGGPATAAKLNPMSIAVGPDDTLYIGDYRYWALSCSSCSVGCSCYASGGYDAPRSRIRAVKQGIISSIAGDNVVYGGAGVPALKLSLGPLYDLVLTQDSFWYVEAVLYGWTGRPDAPSAVRRIATSTVAPLYGGTFKVPSRDGSEVYEFEGRGNHLRTLDALTGALRYQFGYDGDLLTTVTDASNLTTTIERDGAGMATAIRAPNGQRTVLGYGDDGYLATIDQPGAIHHELTYHDGGLLKTFQNPNGNVSTFGYDGMGRVTSEQMPGGCSWTLNRLSEPTPQDPAAPVQVSVTSAEGRTRSYTIGQDGSGTESRSDVSTANLTTSTVKTQAGVETTVTPDGMTTTVTSGPDPRTGMQAPIPASTVVRTPAGKQMSVTVSRAATMDSAGQTLVSQVDTTAVNGKATTSTYNVVAKTITNVSPVGRRTVTTLDALGRVAQVQAGSLAPTAYGYDARGRLETVTVGTAPNARVTTFGYDELDRLTSVRDPLTRLHEYVYDDANRVVEQVFPDTTKVGFGYDANGNMTTVTPPSRPAHTFGFTTNDLMSSYTPPLVSGTAGTTYEYNLDKQPTFVHLPDGNQIAYTYDSAGRLATTTYPSVSGNVTVTRTYSATTGQLIGAATSEGQSLAFGYDGSLLASTAWSGNVAGSVSGTYNNDFRLASVSVNGANSVAFAYDNDGLLTSVDGLTIVRDPTNGLISDTTLGQVTDHRTYDGYGDLATYEAKFGATSLYLTVYVRDSLGRIEQKTETIQGTTTVWNYSYDSAGRLWQVMQNGVLTATYLYDSNGNRTSAATPSGTQTATHDNQDHLLTYGRWTYAYTPNGYLQTKTDTSSGQVTTYAYDAHGNLRHVDLPDGRAIDYLLDSQDRRVAKKVNGAIVRRWLYKNQVQPVAEFDGSGTLLARYLDGVTIKSGASYRVVLDHLGTPRLLVHSTTGAIVQRLDLDEWGQVAADTSPGFQVFGLAGGIYDPDTGLVRFGVRDYDPLVGRWMAKDPILFLGGDTNLYGYVLGDPINKVDATGLDAYLIDDTGFGGLHQAVAFDLTCNANCTPADPIVERVDYWCDSNVAVCLFSGQPGSKTQIERLSIVSMGATAITQFPMSCDQTAAALDRTIAECKKPYKALTHSCRDVSQGGTR